MLNCIITGIQYGGMTMLTEEQKRMHRVCFTGHRPEKLKQPESVIVKALETAIKEAIADGKNVFITGISPPSHTKRSPLTTVHFSTSLSEKCISFKLSSSNRSQYRLDVVMYCFSCPVRFDAFSALPVLC